MKIVRALSDRTLSLMELDPRAWYADHATHSLVCGCGIHGPDKDCNIGVALDRLATHRQEPFPSGVFLREMLNPPHPRASYR